MVVVFAEKPTVVLRLVESARRQKVGNRFVWVGSHGWTVTDHSDHHLPVSSSKLIKFHNTFHIHSLSGFCFNYFLFKTNSEYINYFFLQQNYSSLMKIN